MAIDIPPQIESTYSLPSQNSFIPTLFGVMGELGITLENPTLIKFLISQKNIGFNKDIILEQGHIISFNNDGDISFKRKVKDGTYINEIWRINLPGILSLIVGIKGVDYTLDGWRIRNNIKDFTLTREEVCAIVESILANSTFEAKNGDLKPGNSGKKYNISYEIHKQ